MAKTTKKTKKKLKTKPKIIASPINHTTVDVNTDLHDSLSDSIFKDSFDKFLGDRDDRRKQLNLKENVRASFNRDSSLECSTISEAELTAMKHVPKPYRYTVCSTPNVKFINDKNIHRTNVSKNYSSDLFESYAQFETSCSGSNFKSDLTKKRWAQDETHTESLHDFSRSINKRIRHGVDLDNCYEKPAAKSVLRQNIPDRSKHLKFFSRVSKRRKPNLNKKTAISVIRNESNENGSQVALISGRNANKHSLVKLSKNLPKRKDSNKSQTSAQDCSPGEACETVSSDLAFDRKEQLSRHQNNSKIIGRVLRSATNRGRNKSNTSHLSINLLSQAEASSVNMNQYSSLDTKKTSDLDSFKSVASSCFTLSENECNGSSPRNEFASSGGSISSPFQETQNVDSCSTQNIGPYKDESTYFRCLRNKPSQLRDSSNISNEISSQRDSSLASRQLLSTERSKSMKKIGRVLRSSRQSPRNELCNSTKISNSSKNDSSDFYGWDFSSNVNSLTGLPDSNVTSSSNKNIAGKDISTDSGIDKVQSTESSAYGKYNGVLRSSLRSSVVSSILCSSHLTSNSRLSSNITSATQISPITFAKQHEDDCSSLKIESDESLSVIGTSSKLSSEISSKLESTCDKSQEESCIILDTEDDNLPFLITKQESLSEESLLPHSNNSTASTSATQLSINCSSVLKEINMSSVMDNSSDSILATVKSVQSNNCNKVPRSSRRKVKEDDSNLSYEFEEKKSTQTIADSIRRVTRNSQERIKNKLSKESESKLHTGSVITEKTLENFCGTENMAKSVLPTETEFDKSDYFLKPSKVISYIRNKMTKLTEEHNLPINSHDTNSYMTNETNSALSCKDNNDLNTLHCNSTISKMMVANDQFLSPREERLQSTNKINSSYVTKRKRNKFTNGAANLPAIMESSAVDLPEVEQSVTCSSEAETHTLDTKYDDNTTQQDRRSVTLHSGKWRRILSMYRRHTISMRSAFLLEQTDVESTNQLKISLPNESHRQTLRHSVSFNLSRDDFVDFNETTDRRAARRRRTSVLIPTVDVGRITGYDFVSTYKARDTILRKCGQSEPLEFADIYSESALRQCRKIGEGVYGEVFMNKTEAGRAVVLKIIPIEGSIEVNGEPQKKFDEILSEIVIALQLSSLRNDKDYMTSSFAEVVQVRCVQGRYPNHLIDLWELYRDNYQTENDHPEIFTDDQLYIVFELANGGQDLEAFQFSNALQSKSAFQQMALALAIAEKKLQFEHRDLHWGNILLSPTDEKYVNFKLNGNILQIPSEGIKVTIIDYTLSRMLYEGIVLYNDLSNDEELFTAHGDYQFDIYRLMKNNLQNDWKRYEPFNNILWLHYIIDKLINGARYKNTKSRKHKTAIEDLMIVRDDLTNYKSAFDSVYNVW